MSENGIILSLKDGVRVIQLNRPSSKNAMNPYLYTKLTETLNSDAVNDDIVVTILTGKGDYFSSGNDLKEATTSMETASINVSLDRVKNTVDAFIKYPKILIAVVNGPAIGIAATLSVLCDIIYASDRAVFDTPFVRMGLCAEGGSSYTFPALLGRSKASEILLLGHKLTAQEALNFNLISKVIPHHDLERFISGLHKYGKLPVNSVKRNKKLIMQNLEAKVLQCNITEIDCLKECVVSDEFSNAMLEFISRKSKL